MCVLGCFKISFFCTCPGLIVGMQCLYVNLVNNKTARTKVRKLLQFVYDLSCKAKRTANSEGRKKKKRENAIRDEMPEME